jgi:hypothetical protein
MAPSNKQLQRSEAGIVLGRGRGRLEAKMAMHARVLKGQWPAAERDF